MILSGSLFEDNVITENKMINVLHSNIYMLTYFYPEWLVPNTIFSFSSFFFLFWLVLGLKKTNNTSWLLEWSQIFNFRETI